MRYASARIARRQLLHTPAVMVTCDPIVCEGVLSAICTPHPARLGSTGRPSLSPAAPAPEHAALARKLTRCTHCSNDPGLHATSIDAKSKHHDSSNAYEARTCLDGSGVSAHGRRRGNAFVRNSSNRRMDCRCECACAAREAHLACVRDPSESGLLGHASRPACGGTGLPWRVSALRARWPGVTPITTSVGFRLHAVLRLIAFLALAGTALATPATYLDDTYPAPEQEHVDISGT